MYEDDPEKRIAELERQLAEARAARAPSQFGPPPPDPGLTPGPQPLPVPPVNWQAPPGPPVSASYPLTSPGPSGTDMGNTAPSRGGRIRWPGASSAYRRRGSSSGRTVRNIFFVVPVLLWILYASGSNIRSFTGWVRQTVDRVTATSAPSAGPNAGSTAPNACDLLTPDIVKPVLGADATNTQNTPPLCSYTSSTGFASAGVGSWSWIKSQGSGQQPVPGLGDEAFFSASNLYVRKGLLGLRITLSRGLFGGPDGDAKQGDAEQAIAQQLLPKL
jgi:hypothetical protein